MELRLTQDVRGDWWWRCIAPQNGQIVCTSHEAYDSRSNAKRAAERFLHVAGTGQLVLIDIAAVDDRPMG